MIFTLLVYRFTQNIIFFAKAISLISFHSTELCIGGGNTAEWQIVILKLTIYH